MKIRMKLTMSLIQIRLRTNFLRFYSFDAINLLIDILVSLSERYRELSVDLHTREEVYRTHDIQSSKETMSLESFLICEGK